MHALLEGYCGGISISPPRSALNGRSPSPRIWATSRKPARMASRGGSSPFSAEGIGRNKSASRHFSIPIARHGTCSPGNVDPRRVSRRDALAARLKGAQATFKPGSGSVAYCWTY